MASNINPTLEPTKSLDAFRFWCQKVLPLVYDDSLSYYEVLGKMVVQLNDVIDNINADTENVLTLKEAFDDLKDYVDNFFDDIEHLAEYAERAEAAQTAANSSAINAASSAVNASISSQAAMDARAAAQTAAQDATASKNDAITAATTATTKAGEAAQSAINAETSKASANQSATLADAARSAAQGFATDAEQDALSASNSADAAATSQQNVENLVENLPSDFTEVLDETKALKSANRDTTGNQFYEFTKNAFIPTNGSTVDINNPSASSTGYRYAVIDAISGDVFTLTNITSGTSPRAWCFIDADGNSLSVASSGLSIDNAIITAPENSAKLVVNDQSGNGMVYKGLLLNNKVNFNEEKTNIITALYAPNEYFERKFFGTNNQRTIIIRKNVVEQIGTAQNGSSYGSYLVNKTARYVGTTVANIMNNLTDDDFSPIFTENQSIFINFEMIYERLTEEEKNTGILNFFTKNMETGVITRALIGGYSAPFGSKKYYSSELCLTSAIPEIIENKNIAIVFTSMTPAISMKIKYDISIVPTNLSLTSNTGILNKSIAKLESRYIATMNYNINDIILVGNNLLIVTQNIAEGTPIENGVNATATTIGELITNILNA